MGIAMLNPSYDLVGLALSARIGEPSTGYIGAAAAIAGILVFFVA